MNERDQDETSRGFLDRLRARLRRIPGIITGTSAVVGAILFISAAVTGWWRDIIDLVTPDEDAVRVSRLSVNAETAHGDRKGVRVDVVLRNDGKRTAVINGAELKLLDVVENEFCPKRTSVGPALPVSDEYIVGLPAQPEPTVISIDAVRTIAPGAVDRFAFSIGTVGQGEPLPGWRLYRAQLVIFYDDGDGSLDFEPFIFDTSFYPLDATAEECIDPRAKEIIDAWVDTALPLLEQPGTRSRELRDFTEQLSAIRDGP